MTRKYYIVAQYAFLFLLGFTGVVKAQNAEEKATKIILQKGQLVLAVLQPVRHVEL
jgi:hypothetical protein